MNDHKKQPAKIQINIQYPPATHGVRGGYFHT
jgi:hypothetical protein